jgi:hypothetical protein
MATTITRLLSNGVLQSTVPLNEVGQVIVKVTTSSVNAANFDEVTQSPIKNLLTYTEQVNNAIWTKVNTVITPNVAVAPNGTLTADKVGLTTVTSSFYLSQSVVLISGITYTQSIYAKAGEQTILQITPSTGFTSLTRYANFNLSTGIIQTQVGSDAASITPVGNGWYRCTYSQIFATSGSGRMLAVLTGGNTGRLPTFTGTAGSGIYIWGIQLEPTTLSTPYQGIGATGVIVTPDFAERKTTTGTYLVSGGFDEVRGMIATNGLAGYWDAGKTESYVLSRTTLVDISGNTRNGIPYTTAGGTITYSTTYSGYLSFSGTAWYDCFLGFTYDTATLVERTVSAWFRCVSSSTQIQGVVVVFDGANNTQFEVTLNPDGTTLSLGVNQTYYTAGLAISLNTWYNVAATESHSGGTASLRLYLNGAFSQLRTYSDTPYTFSADRVRLGCQKNTPCVLLGDIANAQFYTRALTADEIKNNFEAHRGNFGI